MQTATSNRRPFYRSRWWMPAFQLGAVAGLAYILAVVVLRRRS